MRKRLLITVAARILTGVISTGARPQMRVRFTAPSAIVGWRSAERAVYWGYPLRTSAGYRAVTRRWAASTDSRMVDLFTGQLQLAPGTFMARSITNGAVEEAHWDHLDFQFQERPIRLHYPHCRF